MQAGDALLIVDVQNDFCPGGALGIAEGDAVVSILNGWIATAREQGIPIFFSRDWHPPGHASFKERGGPWPPHCVQGSVGAAFRTDLLIPDNSEIVSKGADRDLDSYSAFGGTDLAARLRRAAISRVWIGGLALDYCVRETALDAIAEGFQPHVIVGATRAVNVHPEDGARALADMKRAGVILEQS